MLRLARQGHVKVIRQPKDRPYLYKHPESKIRENSSKLYHYLQIVDIYIELGMPDRFDIEPNWKFYRPDVYCQVGDQYLCVEAQRSKVTNAKMQKKIREFARSYQREEHDATMLWIRTPYTWRNLQAPANLCIKIAPAWTPPGAARVVQ